MKQSPHHRVSELIERIARLNASEEWTDDLNPTQWAALSYLARANRFSRSPSQVAEFMAATRGTISQTLKALARKSYIKEVRSDTDRRWISYEVTSKGKKTLSRPSKSNQAITGLNASDIEMLAEGLEVFVRATLTARGNRPFGQCKTCVYHKTTDNGGFCTLLNETLAPEEAVLICHEHKDAA